MPPVRDAMRDPLLLLATFLGAFVRLVPVLSTDFPINDGGLFAAFVDQVAANGMVPPDHLTYNGTDIPHAYPPAGFYLGAALTSLGIETLDVLRFVPVTLAILTVPAWYLLARELFGAIIGGIAAIVFALLPRSYEWLIAGGGLTRALGLLFVLLALRFVVSYYRTGRRRAMVAGGLLLGLAVLSHPEAGLFGAASAVFIAWHQRADWRRLAAVGALAAATVAPWLVVAVAREGIAPFLAAGGSRLESYPLALLEMINLSFTHEAYAPLGAVLGAIGLFIAVTIGRRCLLGWIALTILVVPAASPTLVTLAWSAAAAIAVLEGILPRLSSGARRVALPAGLGVMVLASVWSPHLLATSLTSLRADTREAMDWVADNVPPGTEVAVITGAHWSRDAVAEWFPYLTASRSVTTVQGQEFTGRWAEAIGENRALWLCASRTADCVIEVRERLFPELELVFIPKGPRPGDRSDDCCLALRESLRATAEVVYDNVGATIFRLEP